MSPALRRWRPTGAMAARRARDGCATQDSREPRSTWPASNGRASPTDRTGRTATTERLPYCERLSLPTTPSGLDTTPPIWSLTRTHLWPRPTRRRRTPWSTVHGRRLWQAVSSGQDSGTRGIRGRQHGGCTRTRLIQEHRLYRNIASTRGSRRKASSPTVYVLWDWPSTRRRSAPLPASRTIIAVDVSELQGRRAGERREAPNRLSFHIHFSSTVCLPQGNRRRSRVTSTLICGRQGWWV